MQITVLIFRDLRFCERCCLRIKSPAMLLSALLDKHFPIFRKILVPSFSGSRNLPHDLEDEGTTIVHYVRNCLPKDTE
jgi:hypothetical protein